VDLNNQNLIKKLKDNDASAWGEIVNLYSDQLFAYALSLCSDRELSSDIVQHVFITVFETRHNLNPDYSLKSYLYKSTYNKFIDDYRKKKSMSALHDQYYFMLNQFASNNSNEDLSKKLKLMNLMISKLPTKTKAIFTLSKQSGLSNIEISESLNISIKTVEGHITKAFKLLREEVKNLKL
jgi:RNA polymerase sigma-70 factor (ECF subfamily)